MPKINPIKVYEKGVGNLYFAHSYVTEVLSTGIFQVQVPEDQDDVIRQMIAKPEHKSVEYKKNRAGKPVLQAPELAVLQHFLGAFARTKVETVNVTELVIFYRHTSDTAYYVDGDDEVLPNGVGAAGGRWENPGHGSHMSRLEYSAGITARVVAKTTARYGGGFHVAHADAELPEGTFGGRLNSFIHVNYPGREFWSTKIEGQRAEPLWDNNPSGLRIYNNTGWQFMPYTEESAKFFYEMMLNVCRLSERIARFLGEDPLQLSANIAAMKSLPNFTK